MKREIVVFVLAASLAVFGQGHGGGGQRGGQGGGQPPGGSGAMGGSRGDHGMGPMGGSRDDSRERTGKMSEHSGSKTPEQLLNQNTKLASRLDSMLPKGTTSQQACSGFKNLGQCVATIHVSHNLDIPFADLKAKMTGPDGQNLGKAIQDLKPGVDAKAESKKGKKQANDDLTKSEF